MVPPVPELADPRQARSPHASEHASRHLGSSPATGLIEVVDLIM